MAPITIKGSKYWNKKCTERQNTTKKGTISNKMCYVSKKVPNILILLKVFAMFFAHRFTFFEKKISEQDLISAQDLKFVKN